MSTMKDTPEGQTQYDVAGEKVRADFEQWYVENAFDYPINPIGSRDCGLQRKAWYACASKSAAELSRLQSELNECQRKLKLEERECQFIHDKFAEKGARLREFEESAKVPAAWIIPGDDMASESGFIDCRISEWGEFSMPLMRIPKGGE
jgi:hypothetical protein